MNIRNLKIEATGDFFRGKISPKIRLSGHWLEVAGFKPGQRVEVQISQPGILILYYREQPSLLCQPER
jgi:Toxin SymE, type I toxin-antitoxin system